MIVDEAIWRLKGLGGFAGTIEEDAIRTVLAEVARMRAAVVEHHAQKGDNRCIEDDTRLYAAFGLPPHDPWVPPECEMLESCRRYIRQRCRAADPTIPGNMTIQQLQDALEGKTHRLVAIGFRGGFMVYLDMTREEAIRRYDLEHPDYTFEDKGLDVKEFEFKDSFGAYEVWKE